MAWVGASGVHHEAAVEADLDRGVLNLEVKRRACQEYLKWTFEGVHDQDRVDE